MVIGAMCQQTSRRATLMRHIDTGRAVAAARRPNGVAWRADSRETWVMISQVRIGARGSALSLAQTKLVQARLATLLGRPDAPDDVAPILPITTSGDRIQDRRLLEAGGKGLFTKELDEALLDGRIDIAVHSLKDLPTTLASGTILACVPARADPRDAFISARAPSLDLLPEGALVGTASLRRQAQLLHRRPDLRVEMLRGNVGTRLDRVAAGDFDATFLALAGLERLGLAHRTASVVDPSEMPPAVAQGALAITARTDDAPTVALLLRLEDADARLEVELERAFLAGLDGSCRTAIGGLARCVGGRLTFIGEALTPDGRIRWRREGACEASAPAAHALGREVAASIRAEAGDRLTPDLA